VGQLRVELPTSALPGTTDVNAAYWNGERDNLSPITKGGDHSFHFNDVGGPMDLANAPPFDATKILRARPRAPRYMTSGIWNMSHAGV
jgi:hypothetical protein